MKFGLSWQEAHNLSLEEVLCLLSHAELLSALDLISQESRGLALLPFADPQEQRKALSKLQHEAARLIEDFYRTEESPDTRGLN
jgi:hypothetical protein